MNVLAFILAGAFLGYLFIQEASNMATNPTWNDLINSYAADPPNSMIPQDFARLIRAVIQKESNWNSQAIGSTGDIGLMQINPANAPAYGLTPSQLFDPEINIRVGVDILRWSINNYGLTDGLAAYNGGPAKRKIDVTQRYAADVLNIYNSIA